jgi:UDP-2,3-diacylglucosamine pyrophosphatase LpxH
MSKRKLSAKKVAEIKAAIASDTVTQAQIARKFKISRSLVSDIATGRAHADSADNLPKKKAGGQRGKLLTDDTVSERVVELESEIIHLTDERNTARRQLKIVTKTHGLFKAVAEEMERIIMPFQALPSARGASRRSAGTIEETVVMHMSDGHHDQIVRPIECGGLENHDFKVSMARAEHYVDTVIKWTQETLAPTFKFPSLTVLAYGDHTSGEIHKNTERSYFKNAFKNSLAIGQLHSLMFRDLAPYFDNINVVYIPGNHGRRSVKKDYHGAHDNWDYLVAQAASLYCRDIGNINFTVPDTWTVNLDINGIGFCVFHGDDIKTSMGIPWYGLGKKQNRIMALNGLQKGTRVQYYCCGHFHRPGTTSELDGELLINGAWVATDAYVFNSFSGYSVPTQLLHGVHPKYGITWRLPVQLRSDTEQKGPKRYQIDLMKELCNPEVG